MHTQHPTTVFFLTWGLESLPCCGSYFGGLGGSIIQPKKHNLVRQSSCMLYTHPKIGLNVPTAVRVELAKLPSPF